MADLTIVAGSVKSGANAVTSLVQAGEALTNGNPVYLSSTDGKYYIADANDATKYDVAGVALTGASTDEYFILQTDGPMNLGATTVTGEIYILSATAGGIAPCADLTTGWYPVVIGMATATDGSVILNIKAGTTAHS